MHLITSREPVDQKVIKTAEWRGCVLFVEACTGNSIRPPLSLGPLMPLEWLHPTTVDVGVDVGVGC